MKLEEIAITNGVRGIIEESSYPETTSEILLFTIEKLKEMEIYPTEIQLIVLTNHLGEMVKRSKRNEMLMSFDIEIFNSIPEDSLKNAEMVVDKVGNLVNEEKYLLAVHFETAKLN